jgi:hypothetical protein
METMSPGAPFLFALLWWAGRRGVENVVLGHCLTLQEAAGGTLERIAGSPAAAYAMLAAFARARAREPDTAFGEEQIREQLVWKLLSVEQGRQA